MIEIGFLVAGWHGSLDTPLPKGEGILCSSSQLAESRIAPTNVEAAIPKALHPDALR